MEVDVLLSHGCWESELGGTLYQMPEPVTGDLPWHAAEQNPQTLVWQVKLRSTVQIQDPAKRLPESKVDWDVLIEVPAPSADGSPWCPADGSSASFAAGASMVGATVLAPKLGLAVAKYVYPGQGSMSLVTPMSRTSAANAKVAVQTQTVRC